MCQQTVLGFCVLVKETFFNATTSTVNNQYPKGAVIQIVTVLPPICHVLCLRVLRNTAF